MFKTSAPDNLSLDRHSQTWLCILSYPDTIVSGHELIDIMENQDSLIYL